MFRLIKEIRPDYIIGENVPGLLSIEGGVVFEQVCLDLESEGYEVQAFVLPACATGAPHRRDRVWIVAYSNEVRRGSGFGSIPKANGEISEWHENAESCNAGTGTSQNSGSSGCPDGEYEQQGSFGEFGELGTGSHEWNPDGEDAGVTAHPNEIGINRCGSSGSNESKFSEGSEQQWSGGTGKTWGYAGGRTNSHPGNPGHQGSEQPGTPIERPESGNPHRPVAKLHSGNYWGNWPSQSPFHSGYDGLSEELVRHIRTTLGEAGETPENIEAYLRKEANWLRKEAIKCAGNAIVPQVVLQVMKAIQNHYENTKY